MNSAAFEPLLREALVLALRGRGRVEPNPRVGALALEAGRIVGRGHHASHGGPHAEVEALRDAAAKGARPDTMIVTLEPCSGELGVAGKKTPPCTEALVRAGIRHVVFGQFDPDPRHHGKAEVALRAAGVQVTAPVLEAECAVANRPFARWLRRDTPWSIAKWAMSLDGKTAASSGDSRWITGHAARVRVHEMRAAVDAVMIGFRTALVDDPELTVREVEGSNPIRIVVDPQAALPPAARLVVTAHQTPTWLLIGSDADPARVDELAGHGVHLVSVPVGRDGGFDLAAAMRGLRSAGLRRILVEGGGALTARLLDADLIDQVMAFVAPKIVGGTAAPSPVGGLGRARVAEAWHLTEMSWEGVGEDLLVHAFAP